MTRMRIVSNRRASGQISDRDMRQLARKFEDVGLVIRRLSGGHYAVEHGAERIAVFSGTRVDYRARRNVQADVNRWLRERGLVEVGRS